MHVEDLRPVLEVHGVEVIPVQSLLRVASHQQPRLRRDLPVGDDSVVDSVSGAVVRHTPSA